MPPPPLAVGLPPICTPLGLQVVKLTFEPALAVGTDLTVNVVLAVALHPLVSLTVNE